MRESQLHFGVLGPLVATAMGTPLALGTPKQRAVLALLVINRNRPVSTESLISALWEESPAPAARTSVQAYVSNLRKLFGNAGINSRAVLAAAAPGYRLAVADGDLDLDRFVAEKSAGLRAVADGRFHRASGHLSAALALWRGPVLDDLHGFGFVQPVAAALAEDRLLVHSARFDAEIACGRAQSVIAELETLVAEHQYREPLWAQLITAYYIADRQSDALSTYRRLRAVLADNLGVDPGPTVAALHGRILRRERLDLASAARTTAALAGRDRTNGRTAAARLCDTAGRVYQLRGAATRIGRLDHNDVVLDFGGISRQHAVIIDTGLGFVIVDLGSANGVEVQGRRIRPSASLIDGHRIRIGGHEFTFEV